MLQILHIKNRVSVDLGAEAMRERLMWLGRPAIFA